MQKLTVTAYRNYLLDLEYRDFFFVILSVLKMFKNYLADNSWSRIFTVCIVDNHVRIVLIELLSEFFIGTGMRVHILLYNHYSAIVEGVHVKRVADNSAFTVLCVKQCKCVFQLCHLHGHHLTLTERICQYESPAIEKHTM